MRDLPQASPKTPDPAKPDHVSVVAGRGLFLLALVVLYDHPGASFPPVQPCPLERDKG